MPATALPRPLNPAVAATMAPPVMEARRWLAETPLPPDRPLINLSQAAPVAPPPEPLRRAIAEAALSDAAAHGYGPVLGLPELRAEVATRWSAAYGGRISEEEVAITLGCNQAFCAAVATLAAPGDNVILPTPWYFNHAMWLSLSGIETRPLAVGADLLPDPDAAARLIDARTRALVLVTPNNPVGAEYPADLVAAFADLAARHGLALILDETYRDFDSREGRPHDLFADPGWGEVLIHLYSFSKAFRLPGHRVGAMVASRGRLAEVEKVLDTLTICPPGLGQRAALYGLRHLGAWLAGEREEILARRRALLAAFADLEPLGWRIEGAGAYFAWLRHPWPGRDAAEVARELLARAGVLLLPGGMFTPPGDARGREGLRLAFANADAAGLAATAERLAAVSAGAL
ncbi:MAG: aminotransferase [Alphaproteobacteria bacterium]|nr:MAG: aminotransferase [Alphaproteobacteria bacterium]